MRSLKMIFIGFIMGIVTHQIFTFNKNKDLNVGDCVRRIGNSDIEKITIKTKNDLIETKYKIYDKITKLTVYNVKDQKMLVKMNCKTKGI